MTRLNEVVDKMIIKDKQMCLGDKWHNEAIQETFKDVKSNKFNIAVANFVLDMVTDREGKIRWYYHTSLTKTQLKKLNAIMKAKTKAKTKATLQKRVYAFSNLITSGMYSHLLNKGLINSWVEFCNTNKLEHGLVKVDRVKHFENQINSMLASM